MTDFESPKQNGEQNIVKDNKPLSTNFTVEIKNWKVEGLLTYSLDQQVFKFKVTNGHKESQETSNSDKLTNLEFWVVYVNFKSYEQKWTIDGILKHMGFYPQTKDPCAMMRENLKTQFIDYIVIYQDDLCIPSQTPEEILNILQVKCKININPDFYLGGNYPHDPGGTMIGQLSKYLDSSPSILLYSSMTDFLQI